MNYVRFLWVFFFLTQLHVEFFSSPTLSLVKSCVAFDVIRPHTPGLVLSSSGLLPLRSDLCKLASNPHGHHYHLASALGLSLLYISLDWPESLLTDLWSLVLSRLSVPHSFGHLCRTIRRHQLKWQRVGNQIELEAPSEIEHNAKRCN